MFLNNAPPHSKIYSIIEAIRTEFSKTQDNYFQYIFTVELRQVLGTFPKAFSQGQLPK